MTKKSKHPAQFRITSTTPLPVLQAFHALHLLKAAYDRGAENGGEMEWDDVDHAYEQAIKALKMTKEI